MALDSSVIGKPTGAHRVTIERGPVSNFARALKDDNAVYHDPAAAKAAGFADIPAPPLKAPPAPRPVRAAAKPLPPPVGRMPAGAKAAVWAACVIVALPAVWAAFLTYYGGFLVLFLLAFTGLTVTIGTTADKKAAG